VFGVEAQELGKSFDAYLSHVHPEDLNAVMEALRVSVDRGSEFDNEHRVLMSNGRERWVAARATAFADRTGRVERLVGTIMDVTGRHRADDERRKLEDELRHAQKMEAIGRLASGVAHDFNNLLTVIKSSTTLLLASNSMGTAQRDTISGIDDAVDRAGALVTQLLAFSKTQKVERAPVDLHEVLRDASGTLERLLPQGIHLVLVPSLGVPPVFANRSQLDQVLLNLVVNARDAMPNGGTLTVSTKAVDGYAEIEVRDTGVGMTPEVRSQAFEPFFTTKDTGSGIGLATVYGIVTGSGGTIEARSEPGRGSSFIVRLPLASRA
jgi:PAS domain S-box-containing protein